MATEKTLNARLKLKIDSYENWAANDPVLLDGEVAFASVSVKQDGTANYVPSVLMKVGQNGKKYSELDYVYAKAADVITACKSEAALTTFINNAITGAGIATDEALATLTGRVTTAENDIDALEVLVGDIAVGTQISNAIEALDLSNTYEAKGAATAQILTEIGKLDKEDAAVNGQYVSAVSETDGIITVTRANLPDYTDTYATKDHDHAIADVTGLQAEIDKVATLIGSDSGKSVRTIANEELVAQLIPETAQESMDTLQEIANWIQQHPDDASAMNTAINALESKVGDKSVSAQITAAIAGLEADTHTHANKTTLDGITDTKVTTWDAAVQTITTSTGLTATKSGTDVTIDFDDSVTWIFDCGSSSINV